jgi:hypothetical protein
VESIDWKRFNNLTENPKKISGSDFDFLKVIADSYPFFSAVQILMALSANDLGSIVYENNIRKAALLTGDREILFSLIEESVFEPNHEFPDEPQLTVSTVIQPAKHLDEKRKELLDTLKNQVNELKKKKKRIKDSGPDHSLILLEKIQTTNDEALEGHVEYIESLKNRIKEAKGTPESINEVYSDKGEEWIPNPVVDIFAHQYNQVKLEEPIIKEQISNSDSLSFVDWLNVISVKKTIISEMLSTIKTKSNSYGEAKLLQRQLTDFPDKVPQANPEDIISESLARVYMSQKYYQQAIEVFEKLSLKYPDKKLYFATQIEKARYLINKK